jgi:type IV secretory pathway VirB2 component (pilin)
LTEVMAKSPYLFERVVGMQRTTYIALYIAALAIVIVGVDLLFFKHRFWERLMVNIGIVLVFAAFYLRFVKHP